jgi:hypothetical protein
VAAVVVSAVLPIEGVYKLCLMGMAVASIVSVEATLLVACRQPTSSVAPPPAA